MGENDAHQRAESAPDIAVDQEPTRNLAGLGKRSNPCPVDVGIFATNASEFR